MVMALKIVTFEPRPQNPSPPSQVPIDNNLTAPGEDSSNVIHADVLLVEPPDGGFEVARGGKPEAVKPTSTSSPAGKERQGHPKAIDVVAFKAIDDDFDNSTTEKGGEDGGMRGPKAEAEKSGGVAVDVVIASGASEPKEENEKENQVTQPTDDFDVTDKDNQVGEGWNLEEDQNFVLLSRAAGCEKGCVKCFLKVTLPCKHHGSCSTSQLPVELSENLLQNLFHNLPPAPDCRVERIDTAQPCSYCAKCSSLGIFSHINKLRARSCGAVGVF